MTEMSTDDKRAQSAAPMMSTMDQQTARKVDSEIVKLLAETAKLNAEPRWITSTLKLG